MIFSNSNIGTYYTFLNIVKLLFYLMSKRFQSNFGLLYKKKKLKCGFRNFSEIIQFKQ